MKHLKLSLTDKNYYLLQRIAQADDRRLNDLIYLVFSTGLSSYFCERAIYFDKDENEITIEEKAQIKNNALKLIKEDYKEIEENIIKENTPKEDKMYSLVDSTNKKSIVNGNTWNDSEVKNND